MSDDPSRPEDELPVEPILVPEEAVAPPWGPVVSPPISVAAPRPPRVWTVFVLYVVAIVGVVALNVVLVLAMAIGLFGPTFHSSADFLRAIERVTLSNVGFFVSMLATQGSLAGVAILAAALSPVPLRQRLRITPVRLSPLILLVGLAGTLAVSMIVTGLDGLGWVPRSPMLEEFGALIGKMSGLTLVGAVLVIGLGPGIGEELLFRGYIQTRLRRRWGPGWAIFCTSLMFGVMHFDPVQGTFAMGVGLFLGYLTERTGSLWPAIVCHTVNNMVSTLEVGLGGPEIEGALANAITVVASILVVALSVAYLRRRVRPAPTEPSEAGQETSRSQAPAQQRPPFGQSR